MERLRNKFKRLYGASRFSPASQSAHITAALARRFTGLFAGITALVLTGALLITYAMACAQARTSEEALLASTLTAMEDTLRYQDIISFEWLAQQESVSHSSVFVVDNGSPLQFSGVWQTATPRAQLLQHAMALPACATVLANVRGARAQATLTLPKGEVYTVRAVCLTRASQPQAYVTLFVLQDMRLRKDYALSLLLRYAALWLCGMAILCFVSFVLVRRALRPAAVAWQQQAEFVAAAGHELRSPLAVISASLAAAQPEVLSPEAQGFVITAQKEAKRMARLTEDLLLLAAGDAGGWQMQMGAVWADTLCIELYERFVAVARAQGRTLTLQLPEVPLPCVSADAQYFPQLLSILLQNALDHTPQGTPIEISARCISAAGHGKGQKEAVLFAITDHGAGISQRDKETLFQRFVRLDKSRTNKAHFGLGLAVAQEIAFLHRSQIRVEDTPGGGARFSIGLCAARRP